MNRLEARLKRFRSQGHDNRSGWRETGHYEGKVAGDSDRVGVIGTRVFDPDIETEDLGMAIVWFRDGAVRTILYAVMEATGEGGSGLGFEGRHRSLGWDTLLYDWEGRGVGGCDYSVWT